MNKLGWMNKLGGMNKLVRRAVSSFNKNFGCGSEGISASGPSKNFLCNTVRMKK